MLLFIKYQHEVRLKRNRTEERKQGGEVAKK